MLSKVGISIFRTPFGSIREYNNKISALATWPYSFVCVCVFVFFQKQCDTGDTCHKALPTEKMQAQLISST